METYIVLRGPQGSSQSIKRTAASVVSVPSLTIERLPQHALADLGRDPSVIAVTQPMITRLIKPISSEVSESQVGDAWGVAAVHADRSTFSGAGVKVAVLDTGIDSSHPAFAGVSIVEKDFTGEGNGDDDGHGTHCAGTIFGRDVEGRRIGVARGVGQALIGKVIGRNGGSSEMIFEGMQWALRERANILSMSLGFDFPGEVEQKVRAGWPADLATSQALETYRGNLRLMDSLMAMFKAQAAFNCMPLVIAAAGNESRRSIHNDYKIAAALPAAVEGVLSVAAATPASPLHGIADFSNSFPRLTAPGLDILSAWPEGSLRVMSGTSMAGPHVAGVAALWWERLADSHSFQTAQAVEAHLFAHARKSCFQQEFNSSDYGHGLITSPVAG